MKRIRIVDLPMIVKIGFAPALAMVMMVLLSTSSVHMLQEQIKAVEAYNQNEIPLTRGIQDLVLTVDDVQNHMLSLITAKLTGAPPVDIEAQRAALVANLTRSAQEAQALREKAPDEQKTLLVVVAEGHNDSANLIRRVDFNNTSTLLRDTLRLEEQHARNRDVLTILTAKARQSRTAGGDLRMAQMKNNQALTIQLTLLTLLGVALVAGIAVLNVRRSVASIADATEALARGERNLDLDAMTRKDELGAIVRSLIVFDASARKLEDLRAQQETIRGSAEETRRAATEQQNLIVTALAEGLDRLGSVPIKLAIEGSA